MIVLKTTCTLSSEKHHHIDNNNRTLLSLVSPLSTQEPNHPTFHSISITPIPSIDCCPLRRSNREQLVLRRVIEKWSGRLRSFSDNFCCCRCPFRKQHGPPSSTINSSMRLSPAPRQCRGRSYQIPETGTNL